MKTRSKSRKRKQTRKGGADALTLLIGTVILYGAFGGIANAVKSRYNSEPSESMPSDSESMPSDSESMPSDVSESPSEAMPSDVSESPSEAMPSESPSDIPEAKKGGRRTRRR